ncbi:MAG: SIMPL domain-containing protein [Fastidiosipilaceae bacterium]|jgi:uncharacterized protein YggE|nr:SIMPL domain-containing protein [Clostridiaceae bacterium]
MTRTIKITGKGSASAAPDSVEIYLYLKAMDMVYDKAFALAKEQTEQLRAVLISIGFDKKDLKTTNFNVNTEYKEVKNKKDEWQDIFVGYQVRHNLKLKFPFDNDRLAEVLHHIATGMTDPQMDVKFTVSDRRDLETKLLISATKNAKEKAIVLCEAAGVTLGDLLSIDYSWTDINVFSPTDFSMGYNNSRILSVNEGIGIEPEDVKVADTATFIWQIQ